MIPKIPLSKLDKLTEKVLKENPILVKKILKTSDKERKNFKKYYHNKQICGNCKHSDNDLGIVSLRCDLIVSKECTDFGKVRSYEKCHFKCSKFEKR